MDNVQHGNVGNLGDILKHAALVSLGTALCERAGSDVAYVETHSFLLSAPIADADDWRQVCSNLAAAGGDYARYVGLEADRVAHGEYRCSAGLAQDVLSPAASFLAEANPQTREELAAQAEREELTAVTVVEAADRLPEAVRGSRNRGLLMLVDPFEDPSEHWPTVRSIVRAVANPDLAGAILVFAYRRSTLSWPPPPDGFTGPVATIARLPFQLAAYATGNFESDTLAALDTLGWQTD